MAPVTDLPQQRAIRFLATYRHRRRTAWANVPPAVALRRTAGISLLDARRQAQSDARAASLQPVVKAS